MIITVDGPTASGKSSVAQAVAKRLGYYYFNSGLLYRSLAYILLHHYQYNKDQLSNPNAQDFKNALDSKRLVYTFGEDLCLRTIFDMIDITSYLKDKEIDQAASIVSSNEHVREVLIDFQRSIGRQHNVVTDGRDMGSVIFPYADAKFFLTARIKIRAQRWILDQKKRGNIVDLYHAVTQLQERDLRDKARNTAPLVVPKNAIIIDSSDMTQEQVIEKVIFYILKRHPNRDVF
ncbi:(d)CMP kinase [Candidatus Dependentiae bacterium]|nr:(d)CMP kinase [Candidatus Dependentiae bacterium]